MQNRLWNTEKNYHCIKKTFTLRQIHKRVLRRANVFESSKWWF